MPIEIADTAYHESGHAVVRFVEGRQRRTAYAFKSVSIANEGDSLGRVLHSTAGSWFNPEIETTNRVRDRIEVEIMSLWAGTLASTKAGHSGEGAEADQHAIVNLGSYMNGSDLTTEAYIEWLRLGTSGILDRPIVWRAVESLSDALLEKTTIRWKEGKQIIREALLPAARS